MLFSFVLRLAKVLRLIPVLALLVALDAHAAPAASLHITEAQWQSVDAPGFSTPPLTLSPAALPDRWQSVTLPHALPIDLLHQATAGAPLRSTRTTWFKVSLPDLKALPGPLALYGARIKTDGTVAVYIDGHLVHRAQPQGLHWNSSREPLWVLLENDGHNTPPREILIRLEHSRASQVALSSLWLGTVDSLSWRYRWRQWFQLELPSVFNAAFMAVGVFALLVWFRRRQATDYLLFFAVALASVSRGLHFSADFPVARDWFGWLTANSLFWMITVVHISIERLHGRPHAWLTRTLLGFCALVGVLTLPLLAALPITPRVTPLLYFLAPLMSATVGIVGGLSAWRRSTEAMLVAMGIGICTGLGVVDWLLQNNFISPEGWYLGVYNNAITFGIFGYLMYRRYVGAITDVEQVNAQLEQRLQTREAELADSYERLRAAEQRQTLSQERQRLTQDMHDGLGSSLVSALRVVEAGRLSETEVAQVLKSCIDDLKLTIDSMEPVEADLLLLLATLRFRLGPRLASAGITLRWEVVDVPALDWLDPRNALHILRILQEAFANILKHTEASEIRVSTSAEDGGVSVTIADNGQGFSHEEAFKNGGKGLKNQLRRAQSIGGKVRWESPGRGSRMILWVPEKRRPA
ncbi:ATP-binding protein [Polaromonas sp. UC242_47]|uniref:ATP-binding protein n=1 Tax=Polaromonas sp. UC242_47 TaxID=3374626 RepID=UPI0037B70677